VATKNRAIHQDEKTTDNRGTVGRTPPPGEGATCPPGGAYVAALQGLGPIERVCVQMPDPWFKKRHRPRRVMTPPSGGGGFP